MTPRSRFQPEFRHFPLLLSVNMWRLRTLVAVEKEAKWADSGDRRQRQILPDCSSVPVALPAAGRALHAGVTDGVRRGYRVLGRPVRRRPNCSLMTRENRVSFALVFWQGLVGLEAPPLSSSPPSTP